MLVRMTGVKAAIYLVNVQNTSVVRRCQPSYLISKKRYLLLCRGRRRQEERNWQLTFGLINYRAPKRIVYLYTAADLYNAMHFAKFGKNGCS